MAGGATSTFDPLTIPGLVAWWDASDTATISHTAGAVDSWADKSSSGFTVTNTGTNRPVTGTRTLNGLNVIDFDGSSQYLTGGDILDIRTDSLTVFAVIEADTLLAALQGIVNKSIATGSAGRWGLGSFTVNSLNILWHGGAAFNKATSASTGKNILSMRIDRANFLDGWKNGSNYTTDAISTTTDYDNSWTFGIGSYNNTAGNLGSNLWDGTIAEIIIAKSATALTNTEVAQVHSYLNDKWAVY